MKPTQWLWCVPIVLAARIAVAGQPPAPSVLERIGVVKGICVVLGDPRGETALKLARGSQLTVFAQNEKAAEVRAACEAADEAGLYGTRIFVAKGDGKRIGLADGLADAVIAAPSARAEILRVLRPGGVAILGDRRFVKPWPQGTDVWSHHYHGPDNNPQSRDTLARAPYRTQFIVEPRYGPCPQNCVAAGGRVFMAFGHVAWHRREEPWLNTLVCLNGFNGTLLWKRPLKSGIMVDRSTMIATPDTLYLADDESCKLIDPATGKVRHEILPPQDVAGGTFWKWMALDGDTLYALIGAGEAPDRVATWQRKAHGWPWGGISDGYNLRQRDPKTGKMLDRYRWGFAHVLLAIDIRSKRVLWSHKEEEPIDSRSLCLRGGRLYFAHFGRTLACLDASSGTPVWRRTAAKDAKLFQAIGPYRSGHGYVGGWKSTVYLKATDKALYFIGPQVNHLTAVSADDGHFLWKYGAKDLHVVIRDDALYTIGPQRSQGMTKKLHPMTGEVLASYDVHRRACTRSTGTADGILFRASGGAVRLDVATGKPQWISPMRPSCQVGVVVAHGHLYWVPWVCDCNLQMFGTIALAPASPDDASRPATRAACFENGADVPPATLAAAPADWPTYRGDCARRAVSQATLPAQVGLHWTRKPQTAFTPTAPVAVGGLVLLSGSDGIVRALDAATGAARWRAYTGGAVRYPPAVATGRAFVGSGDGWVYCLDAATGKLVWRFRAAPAESRINLYGQLSSAWPVASGVAVHDGVAYLAAGITDFDGTRVLALDAATGAIRWQNTTCGHLDRFSRRGVACQGDLLLHKGKLYLAGGNAVSPGVFDAKTGHCLTPPPTSLGTNAVQGSELHLAGDKVQVTGQPFYSNAANPVWSGKRLEWRPMVVDCANARLELQQRNGAWFLIATGKADPKQKLWEQALPAAPVRWGIAVDAQGRVVVTLRDGRVVCFGTKA